MPKKSAPRCQKTGSCGLPSSDAETAISLAGSSVTMANGDDTELSLAAGQLFVNESTVVATDVAASNGIIHVIDTVLIPH